MELAKDDACRAALLGNEAPIEPRITPEQAAALRQQRIAAAKARLHPSPAAAAPAEATPASAGTVPAEVASLLSRLSLSSYASALCDLGMTSMDDLHLLDETLLKEEVPSMKPLERRRLLEACAQQSTTAAPAPAATVTAPGVLVRALVIGVDAYGSPVPGKLANAVSDARAVHAALSVLPGAAATLLTDCTRAQLEQALVDFRDGTGTCKGRGMRVDASPAPSGRTKVLGVVFFAGHGLQVSGRNYLVPADFRVPNKNDKLDVMLRDTAKACIALSDVEQALEDAGMFAGAVLLDCCRNVPDFLAELGATRSAGATRALPMGMADVKTATDNLLVAFATAPGTCALDRSSRLPAHSPFTAALLKALEAPRRLNDLGMALVDEVLRDTRSQQRPQAVANYGTEAGTLMLG